MIARVPLEDVARETVAITRAGSYKAPSGARVEIGAAVEEAVSSTRLLREADLRGLVHAKAPVAADAATARVRCVKERSGDCARMLLSEGARRVAVLNYANGVHPGGGFLQGARAQEESLCRCSALYACLTGSVDARAFYEENLAAKTALVTDHVLVSPDVPFFRDDDLRLLDEPFHVTVLTAAAPDLGWLHGNTRHGGEPQDRFLEVPAVFARRTEAVLAAAHDAGCDAVVAGPWGCGAFGNDPEVVAGAFHAAVARWSDAFREIVFSTWGPTRNREAFERRFHRE